MGRFARHCPFHSRVRGQNIAVLAVMLSWHGNRLNFLIEISASRRALFFNHNQSLYTVQNKAFPGWKTATEFEKSKNYLIHTMDVSSSIAGVLYIVYKISFMINHLNILSSSKITLSQTDKQIGEPFSRYPTLLCCAASNNKSSTFSPITFNGIIIFPSCQHKHHRANIAVGHFSITY